MLTSHTSAYFFSFFKEPGLTSAEALDRLKRLLKIKKAGHCGTLDPMAEGLLVVAVNRATKLMRFVTDARKRYVGEFEVGKESPTHDTESAVVITNPRADTAEVDWDRIVNIFSGVIYQIPPDFSAVRVGGVRSYTKARRGEKVDLPPKQVEIYHLEVTPLDRTRVGFIVECSKGTYVRALIRDIGAVAGTGAILTRLTREAVGPFTIGNAVRLGEIKTHPEKVEQAKTSLIDFLRIFPWITVGDTVYWRLRNGCDIRQLGLNLAEGHTVVFHGGEPVFLLEKEKSTYRYGVYLGRE